MTAEAQRQLAAAASSRAQSTEKQLNAALEMLQEASDGFHNQPQAWNPQQWMARVDLFLNTNRRSS